jgi:hypothetical protein
MHGLLLLLEEGVNEFSSCFSLVRMVCVALRGLCLLLLSVYAVPFRELAVTSNGKTISS